MAGEQRLTGLRPHSKLSIVAALYLQDSCGPRLLLRFIISVWRAAAKYGRKWRQLEMESPTDEEIRPKLRSPTHANAPKSSRGVSPPPLNKQGWLDMDNGWQKHKRAPKWLRKPNSIGGPVYFYLPDDTLWMTGPNGLFVRVDGSTGMLAESISVFNSSLQRMVFSSWKCRTSVTRQWRYKIGLFSFADSAASLESNDAYKSAEDCRFTSSDACLLDSIGEDDEQAD